jgi:lipid-binding SYLF domain-containing protein
MKTWKVLMAGLLFCGSGTFASSADDKTKDNELLQNAGVVMQQILDVQDDIPKDVLAKARCVVVMPSVVKAALIAGGSYGRGATVCRTGKNFDGPWGAPAMYQLEGGSIGLQAGGESTDFVILVMNDRGAQSLLNNKVTFGGDASIVAGPKGRTDKAETDTSLKAQFLSYSRTRGVFLGVSLEGSSIRPDDDANHRIYGNDASAQKILSEPAAEAPTAAKQLLGDLEKASPRIK